MSVEPLPGYRVKARNTSETSENKIHDDEVARRYGFRGALVPGVTVYAYMTHPLVAAFGAAWLERGTASVRFVKPVHDGEDATVAGAVTARDAKGVTASVTLTTAASGECAVLTATLPAGTPTPLNLALYRVAPLPSSRPEATREHLASLEALGTPETTYDEATAAEYTRKVSDASPVYAGPAGRVHPAFLLQQANLALSRNVRMSPWIHAGSVVRHLGGAGVGETLATRGRIRSLFERNGREFVEADLAILVPGAGGRARPVAHVLHTAIYRLPAPAQA